MPNVKFTKNFKDRSSDTGFQFEFFCDRGYGKWMPGWLSYHFPDACSYSYISTSQSYPVGVANKVNEAASWLANRFPQISSAGDALKTLHKDAWENAFATAVQEAKRHFRHCAACDKWVCSHSCWNDAADTCRTCSGTFGFTKSNNQNAGSEKLVCPHCGDETEPGRFCATCGKPMTVTTFCGNCGKQIESERRFKFCPHCGDSLAYLDDVPKEGKESA